MHRVAVLTFGQPRFIKDALAWKAEYWRRAKQLNPEIDIDWYYHIWDGISPNQLFIKNQVEIDYYTDKKLSFNKNSNWLSLVKRIHPADIISEIKEAHIKYGLSEPKFHYDMSYENIHVFYKDFIKERFTQIINNIETDIDIRYDVLKGMEDYYNHRFPIDWAAPISASLAHSIIPSGYYDTVHMTRTDAILDPNTADRFVDAIGNTNNWKLDRYDGPPSYHIEIDTPKPCLINDIWFNDYHYMGSPAAFDIMFVDWKEKLRAMIIHNLLKHYFANVHGLYSTIGSTYCLHTIFVYMSKSKKNGNLISFEPTFNILRGNQAIFREGHGTELGDFSSDAFQKICKHLNYTQVNVRPNL